MTPEKPSSSDTKVNHSGDIPPEMGGERPVREFDKTSLREAVESGMASLPDGEVRIPESFHQASPTLNTESSTERAGFFSKTRNKVFAGLAGVGVLAAGVGIGTQLSNHGSAPQNPGQEQSQGTDPNAFLSKNNNMNYAEADRLLGFYTSGDVDRQSLINALAQCSQSEIDAIRKDIDDYDPNDNSQIVTILNKYGLGTNEIPMNRNARIGDKNTMTYDEVMKLESGFYTDISPDAIQNALAQASEDEITTIRSVLANREDPAKATAILNKYGISTTEWIPTDSATFGSNS